MWYKFLDFIADLWYYTSHTCRGFWRWYKSIFVGRPWYIKIFSGVCSFICGFLIFSLMVWMNFLWLFGQSPSVSDIMNPKISNASYVYSADGKLLFKYFNENRTPVKYEEVNPKFYNALIDTEDERFYEHHGVDPIGMLGAFKDFILRHHGRGASTITQQLVKNMFKMRTHYSTGLLGKIPGLGMLITKIKEWELAIGVEMNFDKHAILTMYVNTVDFGNNSFGIKTAARSYYNTTPDSLTIDQSATLVGLLKATSAYNPRSNPEKSLQRRNVVLYNMVTHGDLAKSEYDKISKKATPLHLHTESANDGTALYFRFAIERELKGWLAEEDLDSTYLYTGGLKIYTTIDTRMQKHAEAAVMRQMYQIQQNFETNYSMQEPCWRDENGAVVPHFVEDVAKTTDYYKQLKSKYVNHDDSVWYYMRKPHNMKIFEYQDNGGGKVVAHYKDVNMSAMDSIAHMLHYMHTGLVAMDPRNGFVKAWVGDVDYKTWQYDKVTSERQPGSTFKLFVYTTAMEEGYFPSSKVMDAPYHKMVYSEVKDSMEEYAPKNSNGHCSNREISMRSAFARSINMVALRTGDTVGLDNVAKMAEKMGIESPLIPIGEKEVKPSLCLGGMDVNLLEMTNAYCTIANYGKHVSPVLVTRIICTNSDGEEEEIYNWRDHVNQEQVISAQSAFLMQQMLKGVLTDGGATGSRIRSYLGDNVNNTDFGGKTGTSNNRSDGWFVGVTPNLVAGVWVGGEYRCIHFRTSEGTGGHSALPICGDFFDRVWNDGQLRRQVVAKYVPLKMDASKYDVGDEWGPDTTNVANNDSTSQYIDGDSTDLGYDPTNEMPEEVGESPSEPGSEATSAPSNQSAPKPSQPSPVPMPKPKPKATIPDVPKSKRSSANNSTGTTKTKTSSSNSATGTTKPKTSTGSIKDI